MYLKGSGGTENLAGFVSYWILVPDGSYLMSQALRIDPKLRGSGVGRTFLALTEEYLLKRLGREEVGKEASKSEILCVLK